MSVHRALIFTSISRAHLIKHSILRLLNHDSSALFVALHDPFNSNNTGEIVGRRGFSGGEDKFALMASAIVKLVFKSGLKTFKESYVRSEEQR